MDLSLTRVVALNCNHTYQHKHLNIHDTVNCCNNRRKIVNLSLKFGTCEIGGRRKGSFRPSQTNMRVVPEMEESTAGVSCEDDDFSNGHILPEKNGGRELETMFPAYMQSRSGEATASRAAAAAAASAKELECRVKCPGNSSVLSAPPGSTAKPPSEGAKNISELMSADPIWAAMRAEARLEAEKEPLLSSYLYASILAHSCFERALGFVLANRLQNPTLLATQLMDIFDDVFTNDADIQQTIRLDVQAVKDRDPSCRSYSWALLYLKGYHALQSYRVAHALWNRGQRVLALALQSRISEVFAVDMHPAARIGKGILLDHGTGIVIGETAVIGDRVSMLQDSTMDLQVFLNPLHSI
ncbi:probable serine acetyltransferase 2 isoform X3 [Cryptomeria japonica]|uniref:probable serine acetyltransferase 2 isoform X3 n=1 Tax=Cryptomeria japonica TaxID=3369 RepID=UPI0027DA4287|nr:probable serine acetyltransferase 2 isoform X3 [Cryptomeria japonica]